MSKVQFIYSKNGKMATMALRYAETLRKLGHGTYSTRMLSAFDSCCAEERQELLVSEAIAAFAAENNVDLTKITGTGKDGRIKKSDVEAFIAVQV